MRLSRKGFAVAFVLGLIRGGCGWWWGVRVAAWPGGCSRARSAVAELEVATVFGMG